MIEAKSFLVVVPNYYGKGNSIAEAFRMAKRAGYKPGRGKRVQANVVAFGCTPEELKVWGDWSVRWTTPDGTATMQWEQTL